jgi:hypothetical protein
MCKKSINKIIILTETPFRYRDYQRFGVEILSKNFHVLVLDMTKLIHPEFWENYKQEQYSFSGCVNIERFEDFSDAISTLANGVIAIDYLLSGEIQKNIRVALRGQGVLITTVLAGLIPTNTFGHSEPLFNIARSGRDFLKKNYSSFRVLTRQLTPLPHHIYDISVLGGSQALALARSRAPFQIYGHSFDYDLFLELREHNEKSAEYIVFLDQDFVGHSDRLITGTKPFITATKYLQSMNNFFSTIESLYGMPVKIAGQPKANYGKDHPFNQRLITGRATAEVVKNASLVLAHFSTSISFAVLWNKPIFLLSTNELESSLVQKKCIDSFQKELKASLLNVDSQKLNISFLKDQLQIPYKEYRQYQEKFIKSPGTLDIPLWQIFSEAVLKMPYKN